MVWNVLLTITTDFTWRLDLEIWPGDMTRRLDPETWPGDLTQRLDPETWPRDFIQRLHTETSPRDFTKRLTWSDPFLQTLPGDLALETWPGDLTRRLDPETWPRDLTRRLDPETWPRDLTRRLDPETSYRDFTQRLHPKTHLEWSFFIISCLQIWSQKFFKFVWRCEKKNRFSEVLQDVPFLLSTFWICLVILLSFLDFHGNIMGNDVSQKYST